MNAGGVPNTCKSNGVLKECDFGQMTFELSGGRVSNARATCLSEGDNIWKQMLIPHKITVPHDTVIKGAIR